MHSYIVLTYAMLYGIHSCSRLSLSRALPFWLFSPSLSSLSPAFSLSRSSYTCIHSFIHTFIHKHTFMHSYVHVQERYIMHSYIQTRQPAYFFHFFAHTVRLLLSYKKIHFLLKQTKDHVCTRPHTSMHSNIHTQQRTSLFHRCCYIFIFG